MDEVHEEFRLKIENLQNELEEKDNNFENEI